VRVGFFAGPWDSGHVARDGAVRGFQDVEAALHALVAARPHDVVPVALDVLDVLDPALPGRLADLDVVVGNCGPQAALLLFLRARHSLGFRLVREIRTTGWVGYAFQEWAALAWHRDGDAAVHTSPSSAALWSAFRGPRGDRFHYPVLDTVPGPIVPENPRRAVFVGRLAAEKGLAYVPDLVAALRRAGWPLETLDLVGPIVEADLVAAVVDRIGSDLTVHVRGAVGHDEARRHLAAADVLLFPTISSVEGSGRAVVEALGAGTAVVASDWVAGHDLLPAAFRVPLRAGSGRWVSGRDPTPWVDLDVAAWRPPGPDTACAPAAAVRGYVRDHEALLDVLSGAPPPPLPAVAPRFHVAWEPADPGPACAEVLDRLQALRPSRVALVDLGGAFKSAVTRIGFDPQVRLDP